MAAGWRRTCRTVAATEAGIEHPLWTIPGASAFIHRGEWMHTLEEGILLHLHASVMHDLCAGPYSGFGTFDRRVDALWQALNRHIPATNPKCLGRLTTKMLGQPETVFPQLGVCKAWESKALVTPMLQLLRAVGDDTPATAHMVRAYELFEDIYNVVQKPGLFLTADDAESLWLNANEFVQHYDWLGKNGIAHGVYR